MCGIIGYIGYRNAADVCMQGLRRLEYRGYDSWGVAVANGELNTSKHVGKISEFGNSSLFLSGNTGIGHTRWATHGVPNEVNAHPHLDCKNKIAVVHNGIIENFAELRRELELRGHAFTSDTDTEVIPHLIEEQGSENLFDVVEAVLPKLRGSYAILVIADEGNTLIAAKNGSPLVIGIGDGEYILASDSLPILDYTRHVVFLEDGDIAEISPAEYSVKHAGTLIQRPVSHLEWSADQVRKGGFPHYMLKEIFEQPGAFSNTLRSIDPCSNILQKISSAKSITCIACGTSANAALIFSYLMESICQIPTRVVFGSEFKYFPIPHLDLVIGVSQSGETADTLTALLIAKQNGASVIGITNVLGSSITRITPDILYTRAGPEISVAATKSFTSQLAIFYSMVSLISGGKLTSEIHSLQKILPEILNVDLSPAVELCASSENLLYVGRGFYYPVALEGALKMKEISYIHAEGSAAGELKHGPFALLSEKTPVVMICVPGLVYSAMIANIIEVKARGSPVICIGVTGDRDVEELADVYVGVPKSSEIGYVLLISVVLQLLAYHTGVILGRDVDMPRNLAKSVTVE